MTSNLHYFKYHCNSLVYNTDLLISHPKIKKKTTLHYIYICIYICKKKIIPKDKNIEEKLGTDYKPNFLSPQL